MKRPKTPRGTLLQIPVLQERFGRPFLGSIGIHVGSVVLVFLLPYLLPRAAPIVLGTGPGGGLGGESITVGLVDELAGGTGMFKPSPVPQPPVLQTEPAPEPPKPEVVPLPQTVELKKAPPKAEKAKTEGKETKTLPDSNVIPTAPRPGAGGTGSAAISQGVGVSIGPGSGGIGDLWYARAVESRIGSNWIKPAIRDRIEIIYTFYINDNGTIRDVRKEKSCGNEILDLTAERAIRASTPLPPLPPELRGRAVQFVAQFIYPPNP